MSEDLIELILSVRIEGPLSEICIERIKTDNEGIIYISGTGPDLSAARVVAVREGMRR